MTSSSPDIDPTQLLRYVVRVEDLTDPERISEVRQQLMGLGLLVDRIDQGEVEVAASHATNPGADGIRKVLKDAGFVVTDITADAG
jgi:hypothetical protein